jgi:DNA-binding transcriptional ArsR family regulator
MTIEKIKELKTVEFFKVLSHEIRVKIISLLYDNIEMSYSDILHTMNLEEGNLNFHLRKMKDFVKITEKKTYKLSEFGNIAYSMLQEVNAKLLKNTGDIIKTGDGRAISRSLIIRRTLAAFIDFSIFVIFGVVLFFISSQGFKFDVHTFHIVIYLQLTLQFAYFSFVVMETYKGQTIGKYAMKIRVIKTNGNKITLLESAIRNVGKVFFLPLDILIGVIFYWKKGYVKFLDYYTRTTVEKVL